MVYFRVVLALSVCLSTAAFGQSDSQPKQRIKAIKDLAKTGSDSIPRIEPYLQDGDLNVRIEAVKAIAEIGTQRCVDPLVKALGDNDPEVQIRATDGLVNFYLPGYLKTGLTGTLRRVGNSVKGKFTDTNEQIVDSYVKVRPEVISGLGQLVRSGSSMESRANAARALGILRGKPALEDLLAALKSKDDQVIYESLVAIQKIHDPSAAPRIAFLLRDLNDRVEIAAIETTGLLRNESALPDLRDLAEHGRSLKVRRAALSALAMIPHAANRPIYAKYINDKDDGMRAAAAEGYARLKDPADAALIDAAFESESKMNPRLSLAFADVALGRNDLGEFSPLRYLINTLNQKSYKGVAQPFLIELTRDPGVRRTVYTALKTGTRDEKIGLGQVLAVSGDAESVKYLEALAADSDAEVAQDGLRSLRTLKARL
jgi:HEAT repeat protein